MKLTKLRRLYTHNRPLILGALALMTALAFTLFLLNLGSSPRAPRLKKSSGDSLYTVNNKTFSAGIGSKSGSPQISFSRGDAGVQFVLSGAAKRDPIKTSATSLTFPAVLDNTDLVYTTLPNGLKEELILHQKPTTNTFLFDLTLQNTSSHNQFNNLYDHTFYDADGKYLFHFEDPFAVDASGNRTDNVILQIARDQQNPDFYSLKLIVDESWLYDPSRAYPISIDPTIVHDTTAEFAAGTLNRLKDTGSGSSPSLETYYQPLPADQFTVGLWHLDETSEDSCTGSLDACDKSANANHGTSTGSQIITTGQILGNAARNFTGANGAVSLGTNSALRQSLAITYEYWVNIPTGGGGSTIGAGASGGHGYGGIQTTLTSFTFTWTPTGPNTDRNVSNSSLGLQADTWNHIAFTMDYQNTSYKLFVNGKELPLTLSSSISGSWIPVASYSNGQTDYFGGRYVNSLSYFNGKLDEIRISNIARSPEEIKAAASRRPYSVYTSPVIDLTSVSSWNSLSWTELGVKTGDGESLANSTGLVAQWNFNETSGTTATNNAGSCGASCNGTLTGFASTSSQDQAAGTGWTAANRRWGAGALMFDGSNDYVGLGTNASMSPTTALSAEAWVNINNLSINRGFVSKSGASGNYGWAIGTSTGASPANAVRFIVSSNGTIQAYRDSAIALETGKWYHVVGTYDGSSLNVYINGKLSNGTLTGSVPASIYASSAPGNIGWTNCNGTCNDYMNGTIDSTHIYSRALTASEILSNYQVGNIELQTRVGADTSPDDGSWEEWKPSNTESQLDNFDNPYAHSTKDYGLVSYWPLDETADDTCSGGEDACDRTGSNHGTATGATIVDGKYEKARSFNGTTSLINVGDPIDDSLDFGTGSFSVEAWFTMASTANIRGIVSKYNGTTGWTIRSTNGVGTIQFSYNGTNYTSTNSYNDGLWHHVAVSKSGSSIRLYVDGKLEASGTHAGNISNTTNFMIGRGWSDGWSWNGLIDEVKIYNRGLTDVEIAQRYTGSFILAPDSTIKIEGTTSQKLKTGKPMVNNNTIAHWGLDETGGSGAYLKDSSGNNNHGTPTGTSLIQGIVSKGRRFNGSSDIFSTNLNGLASSTNTITIDFWAKVTTPASTGTWIMTSIDSDPTNRITIHLPWEDNNIYWDFGNINTTGRLSVAFNSAWRNQWAHWAFISDAAGQRIYRNGVLIASDANSSTFTKGSKTLDVGGHSSFGYYWGGDLDEVRISANAYTPEEVAESYRLGQDHYLNKTISSTDLSGKTSLPFYVAADRPGTYLTATVGESAFANNQTDSNTVGMWRLDEQTGSGAYLKDASGNNNHGTPTGTTSVEGKPGKGRSFNGTSDKISIPHASNYDFGTGDFSVSFWMKANAPSGWKVMVAKINAWNGASGTGWLFGNDASGGTGATFELMAGGNYKRVIAPNTFDGNWHHIVGRRSGNTISIYKDGQLVASDTSSVNINNSSVLSIGASVPESLYFYNGIIDEIVVSNTARTADEIRQTYEVGLRTHPITIDFASAISHSDPLSSSSDLTFTLMATPSGTTNAGDNIYNGDKIIVRQNYDGTEYLAQGTVDSVNVSSGATTVSSWDAGSTFPTNGFGPNSTVFKWQREYWPIGNQTLSGHLDAITQLTLRLTDGAEGRTIYLDDLKSNSGYLTDPTGSTLTSSTGNRYFQYRAILTSADQQVSPSLTAVELDYVDNTPPSTPTLNSPSDSATNQALLLTLQTTGTDGESDYLRYKIELCTNVGMSAGCQTFDQTSSQTGWSGQNTQSSTAYTSGTQASYTLQTPLSPNTTYYWRSYAIDPSGTNTWSNTQGTPYSFTTTTAPDAPTTPYAEGTSNPTGIIDLTPEFSAIHNDSDGDSAVYYEIEVNTASDFTGTVMWDTGAVSMSSLASGVRSSDVSYVGTALTFNGATYYWRIRFTDNKGATGAWSDTQNFSLNSLAPAPTLDEPLNTATNQLFFPTLKTTGTDGESDYLRYKIELCTNVGMSAGCQTFDQTSSQTGWSGQNTQSSTAYTSGTQASYTLQTPLSPNTTYYWRSYAIDPSGTNTWSNTQGTPYSFTTLAAPLSATQCRIQESAFDNAATIIWTDNASNEDRYEIQKSVNGGSWNVLVTNLTANTTSYLDTTVSVGSTYRYRLAPYFLTGPSYGDWCYTDTLTLETGNFFFDGLNFMGLKFN